MKSKSCKFSKSVESVEGLRDVGRPPLRGRTDYGIIHGICGIGG